MIQILALIYSFTCFVYFHKKQNKKKIKILVNVFGFKIMEKANKQTKNRFPSIYIATHNDNLSKLLIVIFLSIALFVFQTLVYVYPHNIVIILIFNHFEIVICILTSNKK